MTKTIDFILNEIGQGDEDFALQATKLTFTCEKFKVQGVPSSNSSKYQTNTHQPETILILSAFLAEVTFSITDVRL
jgi:hypothetical protein